MNCIQLRGELGVYVLGALEQWERAPIEAHLAECGDCRAVAAELLPVPRALALIDQTRLEQFLHGTAQAPERRLSIPAAATPRDSGPAQARRQRPGWLPVAAAAALIVSAGGLWLGLRPDPGTAPGVRTVEATNAQSHVHARVQVTSTATGSALTLGLAGVAAGEHCQLIAIGADGRREVAASWVADYRGGADVHGSVDLVPRAIARLQVQTLEGRVLVVLPG